MGNGFNTVLMLSFIARAVKIGPIEPYERAESNGANFKAIASGSKKLRIFYFVSPYASWVLQVGPKNLHVKNTNRVSKLFNCSCQSLGQVLSVQGYAYSLLTPRISYD